MEEVRTRFAPSPTGFMHIGNLRTALYSYLIAKSKGGKFILRIEDTDQKRYVNGSLESIYTILKKCGLNWDEGPDVGGEFGSYIQSDRVKTDIYIKYAKELIEKGNAYYCFCPECKTDLDQYKDECNYNTGLGYNGHCRNLSKEEIEENLKNGKPFVIRQKIQKDLIVTYHDEVFGNITINTNELDDQVLIKQDGFPTYNFANVIDDHLMKITHVVRGSEYLSSTPKYNLLYKAFGWDIPKYIHLPLIMGNDNGVISKLSKRNGSINFEDFVKDGITKDAILNYIALLGWSPKNNQEIFTLNDMVNIFNIKNINKSSAIFDYKKLNWINGKYIRNTDDSVFINTTKEYSDFHKNVNDDIYQNIILSLKNKISKYTELNEILNPFIHYNKDFDLNYFISEKIGSNKENILESLVILLDIVKENNFDLLNDKMFFEKNGIKKSVFMTAMRVSLTGISFSMLDPIYLLKYLDKNEVFERINNSINRLKVK